MGFLFVCGFFLNISNNFGVCICVVIVYVLCF